MKPGIRVLGAEAIAGTEPDSALWLGADAAIIPDFITAAAGPRDFGRETDPPRV